MDYRSPPVCSTFKLCIINLGDALTSRATNVNIEDLNLLEKIQGYSNVKYCQKIRAWTVEPITWVEIPTLQLPSCVTFRKLFPFCAVVCSSVKCGIKIEFFSTGLRIK